MAGSKYFFSCQETTFSYEFVVSKRKKFKEKTLFRREVYKAFPFQELKNMILSGSIATERRAVSKEEAESIIKDSREYRKEYYEETDFVNDNALFIRVVKGNTVEQLENLHTSSVVLYKGRKITMPTRNLVLLLSKFPSVDAGDYDILDKFDGFMVITRPEYIELFWYLFELNKGYPSQKERLNGWFFDDQPAYTFPYTKVVVSKSHEIHDKEVSFWNPAPIYRDVDNRILTSGDKIALKYASGTTYPAKVIFKREYAIVEAEEYGTAIFVIPMRYFKKTHDNEIELKMIKDYKRFNHSPSVMERVQNYIKEEVKKHVNVDGSY